MGFFDKRSGGSATEWECVDLGIVQAREFGDKMQEAMGRIALARGRSIGTVIPLFDLAIHGKTDDEIREMAQSTVLKFSNQLNNDDQLAITRGDVFIVLAQEWARHKSGNMAWAKYVAVVILH
jgi:hypothetical protein